MQNYSRKNEKLESNTSFFDHGKSIKPIDDGLHALDQALREKKKASVVKAIEHLQKILSLKSYTDVFFTTGGIQFCVAQIAPLLVDDNDKVSEASLSIMKYLLPFFRRSVVTPSMQITAIGISKIIVERLIKMRDMGKFRWHIIWCTWMRLLLKVFVPPNELSPVNSVLKVVEGGFKHTNIDIRTHSFVCWKALLEVLAEEGQLIGKRISFMAIPLYYTTNYNNTLAEVKFSTWWYFLCHIKGNINQESTIVVAPFLKFCFEPYTTVLGGRIVTESVTLSPGKKVRTLHEKVICALVYLLGPAHEAVVNLNKKSGLELATESILSLNIYREIQGDIVLSCQEATLMLVELKDVDNFGICQNLWSNLQKFFLKDNTLKSLKDLFDVMEVLGVQCKNNPKIIPHLHIMIDAMLCVEKDNRSFTPEQLITFLDIMQQAINFLLNSSSEIIKSEQIQKISTFIFEIFPSSSNTEMHEKLLDIFVSIDVKKAKNLSSLHILTKNYINFLMEYKKNLSNVTAEKRTAVIEMMDEKLFKWCLDGFQLNAQYKKDDFIRDWKPICEQFSFLKIKSLRELFNKKYRDTGKDFMDIFEKLVKGDRKISKLSAGQTDNDTFVEIAPKNMPIVMIRTNILTETQKEKLQKRSDDIPALYNDMSQSLESMLLTETSTESQSVLKENVSSSVVEATPNETVIINPRMRKELERLKTDTVEGQNLIMAPRSSRRKSNIAEAKNEEQQPKKIQTRRSSLLCGQNDQKEITSVSSKTKKKDDVLKESPVPVLRLHDIRTPSPEKMKKPSVDHNYHIRLHKSPSPSKVARNSSPNKDLSSDLMVVMLRSARREFEALKKRYEEEMNEVIGPSMQPLAQEQIPSKEPSKTSPSKNSTKVIPVLKIKPFSLESSETQSLFSQSQDELPLAQPMNLSQADTQVQTPEEIEIQSREEPTSLFVECDSVAPTNEETLKNTENTSPNPLTKIFVRVNETSDKKSHKTGHSSRTFYKVKENPRTDLLTSGAQGSPKFTSRAAQMLSMITSSPSTSSKQPDVPTTPKTSSMEDDPILRFSTTCPPPNATPKLSILKRKRDTNLDESTNMTSKKRRISFHDPPVTKTKEYILDESEIAIKQTDSLRRKNLMMDSPPTAEPEEIDENDSDWEDLGDDVTIVEPIVVAGPKKVSKKSRRAIRKNPSRGKDKRPAHPVMLPKCNQMMNGVESETIVESPTAEVPEMKIIFTNEDEVFKYALVKFKDKLFDRILTNSQDMQYFVAKAVEKFGSMTLNEILNILGIGKST